MQSALQTNPSVREQYQDAQLSDHLFYGAILSREEVKSDILSKQEQADG